MGRLASPAARVNVSSMASEIVVDLPWDDVRTEEDIASVASNRFSMEHAHTKYDQDTGGKGLRVPILVHRSTQRGVEHIYWGNAGTKENSATMGR